MRTLHRTAAVTAALFALHASAGVTITTELKRRGKTSTFTLQAEGKNVRMETSREGGAEPGGVFISDGDGKRILVVDYAKRQYHEITQAQMQEMKAKMQAAMAGMKDKLAKLPPAQRAQLEAAMKGQDMGAEALIKDEKYVRASGSKKVAGYKCDLYTVELDGQHVADTCLIPWGDLKIDREQLKQSMESMESTWTLGAPREGSAFTRAWGMSVGVPAWRKTVKDDPDEITETTLVSIARGSVPKTAFEPPAGFTKRALGEH